MPLFDLHQQVLAFFDPDIPFAHGDCSARGPKIVGPNADLQLQAAFPAPGQDDQIPPLAGKLGFQGHTEGHRRCIFDAQVCETVFSTRIFRHTGTRG